VAGRVEWLPPPFFTALAFLFSCRHVSTKPRAEPP
jgi:hypothetical protein